MRTEYDERAWRVNRYIYNRLTERVDGEIGQILDGLKEAGLEENTLIIFTSDHGNMDASHRLASKSFHYEESIGVPFIMKYKGDIPAGAVDGEHLVSTGIDILPTICDYAGVQIPEHLIGKSLRRVAAGKAVTDWREYVVAEGGRWRMLRTENYKYASFSDPDSKETLVNMRTDPVKCATWWTIRNTRKSCVSTENCSHNGASPPTIPMLINMRVMTTEVAITCRR